LKSGKNRLVSFELTSDCAAQRSVAASADNTF
jgi:hypothetical protein